ncbi:MAG: 5'-nucleotidase, partial [Betaproteobacteria bacterium]
MSVNLEGQLVVAISSRALFDFEEENRVYEEGLRHSQAPGVKPDAAYMQLQLERLDVPAKPGVAFSLIKKLLAFNEAPSSLEETLSPERLPQRVEVVILSRNDPVSGMRVFRSAQHYGLDIKRATFNRGEAPWRYLKPLHANLFLSAHLSDVRAALQAGVPAAQVYPQSAQASLA